VWHTAEEKGLYGAQSFSDHPTVSRDPIVAQINKKEFGFTLDYAFDKDGDPTNAYCRSDHYMYARYGIPVVFFSAAAWRIDYHNGE